MAPLSGLRRLTAATALAALLATSAACGGDEPSPTPELPELECDPGSTGLSVVWGARANNPAPGLPEPVDQILYTSLFDFNSIPVFIPDGEPWQADTFEFSSSAGNETALMRDFNEYLTGLSEAFDALRSEHAEADVLESLTLAGRSSTEPGMILVVDSGLQSVDPLDFPGDGLLSADPEDVVDHLESSDYLPDLSGQTVVWVGLGDTTAPQEDLPTPQRNDLRRIWKAVLEASGACVEFADQPLSAEPLHDDLTEVTATPLPENPPLPDDCGTVVYDSSSSLRFERDQDAFVDPGNADSTLAQIAQTVIEDGMRVEVTGTTSSEGPRDRNLELSLDRAEAVETGLVDHGVPEDWIATDGVASDFPGFEPDIGPDGGVLPGPASRNRAVIVELTCTG